MIAIKSKVTMADQGGERNEEEEVKWVRRVNRTGQNPKGGNVAPDGEAAYEAVESGVGRGWRDQVSRTLELKGYSKYLGGRKDR